MNFGRGNYFDRNFSDSREPSFGFSNNSGFDNFARSPVFDGRSHFDSQIPSNFSSLPNRNFDNYSNFQQQQPSQSDSSSKKVYHVPIRIEGEDAGDQSNSPSSYVKINDQQNSNCYQQKNYNPQQPNFQQQQPNYDQQQQQNYQQPNYQNNYPNEQHINSSINQQPSNFYNSVNYQPNNLKSDFKERAEQEFKRQNEELRNKQQGEEYRIPIRIERDFNNESNDLVRDFNKMNCPSAFRTNKPGQKHSTNDFIDGRDFNNVPPSFHHQNNLNQFVNQSQSNKQNQQQKSTKQQPNQQPNQQPQTQQPPKKQDPMSLVQNILEEVEKYEHEIDNFKGEYQDKQYRYLDEYLTRAMLKLDNIDVSVDSNLKQARKNAIIYINRVISKLENIEHQDKKQNVDTEIKNDEQEKDEQIKNDEREKIDEQSNSSEKEKDQEMSKERTVEQENDAKQSTIDQSKVKSQDDELKSTDELETETDKNITDSKDNKMEKSKDKKKKTNEKSDEKKEKKKIKKDDKKDKKEDKKDKEK